jgi:hypothetical protein
MKKNLHFIALTSLLCFFISFSAFSQNRGAPEVGANMGDMQNRLFLQNLISQGVTEFVAPDKLDGSIYMKKEFINSKVLVKNEKTIVEGFALRYNMMSDAMEFIENNETRSLHKHRIAHVNIGGDLFIVATIEEEGKERLKYMKTLNLEKSLALESYEVTIQEPFYHPGMHSSIPNARAVTRTKLFANLPNQEEAVQIDKKADLYALVGDKAKQVKAYMKKNKISIKKQEELQQILEYYVSLIA